MHCQSRVWSERCLDFLRNVLATATSCLWYRLLIDYDVGRIVSQRFCSRCWDISCISVVTFDLSRSAATFWVTIGFLLWSRSFFTVDSGETNKSTSASSLSLSSVLLRSSLNVTVVAF